jgi:putative peptide zinc metalloprotease protein
LESRRENLVLTAPCAGVWSAPRADDAAGKWLPRGTALGQVIGQDGYEFTAVVPQAEASRLFARAEGPGRATVRLRGQADAPMRVSGMVVIQAEQNRLPSAALGVDHGGEIALSRDADGEPIAAESFYEVRARIEPRPGVAFYQGLTGRVSFALPAEPLGWQWAREIRQVFQKRAVN